MATMSIRGLNDKVLARLKKRAEREGGSLNSLVVRILQDDAGAPGKVRSPQKFDDLDALAGTWSSPQARAFEKGIAAFSDVDPNLWK